MMHWAIWCLTTDMWYMEDGDIWMSTSSEACVMKTADLNLIDYELQVMSVVERREMRYEVRPFKQDVG